MIIAGAGGHAKEIAAELHWLRYDKPLYFFDNTPAAPDTVYDIPVLHNEAEVCNVITADSRFIIAAGKPALREMLYLQLAAWGAMPYSLVSAHAVIGHYNVTIGPGANIMAGAVITASVTLGKGVLVNARASIHHDCVVGDFCELSPGCTLLGKVNIGDYTSVGAHAVVLPGITIGSHAIIGAGAVVTKDVPNAALVKGVPGRW